VTGGKKKETPSLVFRNARSSFSAPSFLPLEWKEEKEGREKREKKNPKKIGSRFFDFFKTERSLKATVGTFFRLFAALEEFSLETSQRQSSVGRFLGHEIRGVRRSQEEDRQSALCAFRDCDTVRERRRRAHTHAPDVGHRDRTTRAPPATLAPSAPHFARLVPARHARVAPPVDISLGESIIHIATVPSVSDSRARA